MDGRELRRHWRCLPVRLWDGRAGRISVCRPHRTNVWNHTILLDNQPEREPLNNNEEKQMKKTIIDPFFYSDSVHLIGAVKGGEAESHDHRTYSGDQELCWQRADRGDWAVV